MKTSISPAKILWSKTVLGGKDKEKWGELSHSKLGGRKKGAGLRAGTLCLLIRARGSSFAATEKEGSGIKRTNLIISIKIRWKGNSAKRFAKNRQVVEGFRGENQQQKGTFLDQGQRNKDH